MLISTAMSAIILAAVLSSVLMISKSGYLLNNYTEMEQEARNAMETFATDARMTKDVTWDRADDKSPLTTLKLSPVTGTAVTYVYDSVNGTLTRTPDGGTPQTVISGIQTFTFTAYRYDSADSVVAIDPYSKTISALNTETKMVQLSLSAIRSKATLSDATNNVVSARFVLRNKRREA